jgi:hypothetical protein
MPSSTGLGLGAKEDLRRTLSTAKGVAKAQIASEAHSGPAVGGDSIVLEHGFFVALILLLIWAVLLVFLVRGQLKTPSFGAASMFLALMVPFFWLGSEITELTISQVGSFKTNVHQATQYLDEIKQIRDKLKAQDVALTSSVQAIDEKITETTAKLKAQEAAIENEQTRTSQRPLEKGTV